MKCCTTRFLPTSSHSYPTSQQIPHQTPGTCAFFLSLEPLQAFYLLTACPFAISFARLLFARYFFFLFLPSWPLCLFQNQFKSFFVTETFPEHQVGASPVFFLHTTLFFSILLSTTCVMFYLFFFLTSVSSKRIRSTSALFKTQCCKIGTVSGHKMGLIIIFHMNEASQRKVFLVSFPAFSLYKTLAPENPDFYFCHTDHPEDSFIHLYQE